VTPIRAALLDDAAVLTALALRSKAHWGYDEGFLTRCIAGLTIDGVVLGAGPAFIAEPGRDAVAPAGFVAVDLGGPDGVEVTHLFVDPPAIGSGIGRRLWEQAVGAALLAGAPSVVVEADPNAAGFYRRLGALPIGERRSSAADDRYLPLLRLALD
jgi:GNAT superfamily N-acetyltransferase